MEIDRNFSCMIKWCQFYETVLCRLQNILYEKYGPLNPEQSGKRNATQMLTKFSADYFQGYFVVYATFCMSFLRAHAPYLH